MLFNVFSSSQHIEYHTFGDWDNFRRNYHQLGNAVSIDAVGEGDSVFFHRTAWNEDAELLEKADRIIVCEDDDEQNKSIFRALKQYFATNGEIHLRLTEWDDDGAAFGVREQMMTPELLIHERLTSTAKQLNELYRKSVGADKSAAWGELSEFHRQSNIAAADHLLMKLKILFPKEEFSEVYPALCRRAYQRVEELRIEQSDELRAIEHIRWMRFCLLHNWRYGPVRDDAHRVHPLLRPYESLSEADRAKNDFAWDLFRDLSIQDKESEGT